MISTVEHSDGPMRCSSVMRRCSVVLDRGLHRQLLEVEYLALEPLVTLCVSLVILVMCCGKKTCSI